MSTTLTIKSMVTGEGTSFLAFLTDMSQTFDSTWNTTNVFGRNDPIATFAGTQRTISLAFDIPAGSLSEAKQNLKKCGILSSYLYPGYNVQKSEKVQTRGNAVDEEAPESEVVPVETSKYMSRPPLLKVKFANIINNGAGGDGLLGFITSLSFNPVLEAGMFREKENGNVYPRTISLSFGFTVLHQTELGFGTDESGGTKRLGKIPFI